MSRSVEYELHPRIVMAREFCNSRLKQSILAQGNRWDLYMLLADYADFVADKRVELTQNQGAMK